MYHDLLKSWNTFKHISDKYKSYSESKPVIWNTTRLSLMLQLLNGQGPRDFVGIQSQVHIKHRQYLSVYMTVVVELH